MSRAQLMADIEAAQRDARRPLTRVWHFFLRLFPWLSDLPRRQAYRGILTQNPGRLHMGEGWKRR